MKHADIKAMMAELAPVIREYTESAIAPLIDRLNELNGKIDALPASKDGGGIKNLLIDREGSLIATMDDGRISELGSVVGKDADVAALEQLISDKIDALPRPKDGRDGFSLKDFDATLMEDGRTVLLSFEQGEASYKVELGFPVMIYRGVFKDGQAYCRGDTVTWGGSLWHCDVDQTTDKPDGAENHWTLATKRGRDGKDAAAKQERSHEPIRLGVGKQK